MKNEYRHPKELSFEKLQEYDMYVNNGVLFVKNNTDEEEFEEQHPGDGFSMTYLQKTIQVKDTTFGQFWELMRPNMDVWNVIFAGALANHDLLVFDENMQKDLPVRDKVSNFIDSIDYLEVSRTYECENFTGIDRLNPLMDFGGYGVVKDDVFPEPTPMAKGISFMNMYELKNIPFYITEKFYIYDSRSEDHPLGEKHDYGEQTFTLYDVLKMIFWEITWYGYPDEVQEIRKGLVQRVEDIKSGKIKTTPIEDVEFFCDLNFKEGAD